MESRLADLEAKVEDYERIATRLEDAEARLAELDKIKVEFGTKLKDRLDVMQAETKVQAEIHIMDLQKLMEEAKAKFIDTDSKLEQLFAAANLKFQELEAKINMDNGQQNKGSNKNGFLPDKMMVPKTYNDDINGWRKWKDEVAKYFDEGCEGMKAVMDDVAKLEVPVTSELLEEACKRNPGAVGDKLQRWKHLYRALEKLTSGEAAKVIATVRDENGFEEWRQLHVRFEPELEAEKNVVIWSCTTSRPPRASRRPR